MPRLEVNTVRLKISLHAVSREISVGSLAPLPLGSSSARLLIDGCEKKNKNNTSTSGTPNKDTTGQDVSSKGYI